MAKRGNTGEKHVNRTKGPCVKCGATEGPFFSVISYSPTGRKKLIRTCEKCYPKV